MITECGYDEYGKYPDAQEDAIRKARKPHKCTECLEMIQPGDKYWWIKVLMEGSWDEFHICLRCTQARKDLYPNSSIGCLWENVWELHGFDLAGIDDDRKDLDWSDEDWAAHVKSIKASDCEMPKAGDVWAYGGNKLRLSHSFDGIWCCYVVGTTMFVTVCEETMVRLGARVPPEEA